MELDPVPLSLARDLPCELLFQIASFLSAKDMLNLATTCKKLSSIINSDEAWETKVLDWIFEQDVRADILGTCAEDMMNILGLHTQRSTYQALVMLKFWPCGLWYNADSSADSSFQPEGKLIWVPNHTVHRCGKSNRGTTCFFLSFAPSSFPYTGNQFPWPQVMPQFRVDEQESTWTIQVHYKKGVFCSEVASVDITTDDYTLPPMMDFDATPQDKTQFQLTWNQSDLAALLKMKPDGGWTFKRAGLLHIQQQQASPPPPAPPPGLYYAIYAGHGLEILQLERIRETRYSAVKLTGDANVPATQISFHFDSSTDNVRPGAYDNHRDDPFPAASGPRPMVSFADFMFLNVGHLVVNMEERPVRTVISNAQGQINRNPEVWSPELVQATVVVYDYDLDKSVTASDVDLDESDRAVFSVIFEDQGEPYRHVMDFFRCSIPRARSF
ncbi:hypothetical protein Ndes2437B_g01854 [Nannochloris sp. 'desiccata']